MNVEHEPNTGQKIVCLIDRSMSALILWAWAFVTFMQIPDNRLNHAWSLVCRYIEALGGPSLG